MSPAIVHPSPRDGEVPTTQHGRCQTLASLMRGELCEQFARRPGLRRDAGRYLYFIGEPAKSLYYLKSGLVKTSRMSAEGDETILQLHRAGDVLGELCFCVGTRLEQAVALEPSEVVEIPLVDILARFRHAPDAALELVLVLSERLGSMHDRVQSLAVEPTMERLARTLLLLASSLGEETPGGTQITHYVKQEELAQMVAARREVVSGLLNRLRERGLIQYSRKSAISVRRDALQAYVNSLRPPPE
jgi:CRP/FNR family transcriptional regulator, cyclic AMP receptor protein